MIDWSERGKPSAITQLFADELIEKIQQRFTYSVPAGMKTKERNQLIDAKMLKKKLS